MTTFRLFDLPSPLLLLLGTTSAALLPYNPTTVFVSPQNDRLAYVIQPFSASNPQCQLASLDLTQQLTPTSLSLSTIYVELPFLNDKTSTPFTAFTNSNGDITVYTGSCSSGSGEAELWRLSAQTLAGDGQGNWTQETLTQATGSASSVLGGPNFLAAGISFSSNITAEGTDTDFYVFGGMCPSNNATANTWLLAADYTNNMLNLTPNSDKSDNVEYGLSVVNSQNSPIAEAGHSITALPATYSNKTDGTQIQQQNFLLVGGHTENAFINMSQIALYSLPEEAWIYFPVEQSSSSGKTDLTVRQSAAVQVESRSGHTAVLSEDGKSVIIFGGWVGDVNTPATPQLAILSVGEGYGGTSDWSWKVPSPSGSGLEPGSGVYGHGATVLPGNVMLVLGGYSIPASSSKFRLRPRAANPESLNSQAYLYNITSNSWLTEYTLPASAESGSSRGSTSPLSTTAQKVGLGTGLAFGGVAAAGLLVFYLWYTRKLKHRREAREKGISELSIAAHRIESDEWGEGGIDGRGGSVTATTAYGSQYHSTGQETQNANEITKYQPVPGSWRDGSSQMAQRTGVLLEIPSPTKGLRRNPSGGRGPYAYEKRRSLIHPIAERDEENSQGMVEELGDIETNLEPFSNLQDDPFGDSKRYSDQSSASSTRRTARESAENRRQEFQGWQTEWKRAEEDLRTAPEMTMNRATDEQGRVSPSKSDRTISSLSEHSSRSNVSSRSSGGGVLGLARALSVRSANLLSSIYNPAAPASDGGSSESERSPPGSPATHTPSRYHARTRSHTTSTVSTSPTRSRIPTGAPPPKDPTAADTFAAAPVPSAELAAQSEALLGGRRPDASSAPPSPVKEAKRVAWVDSVRRAFSGSARAAPAPAAPSSSSAAAGGRAASDAAFWRSRRGARDWDYGGGEGGAAGEAALPRASGDWDVERAVEGRVVQLMFTVPRGELRVVNADLSEAASLVSEEAEGEREMERGG